YVTPNRASPLETIILHPPQVALFSLRRLRAVHVQFARIEGAGKTQMRRSGGLRRGDTDFSLTGFFLKILKSVSPSPTERLNASRTTKTGLSGSSHYIAWIWNRRGDFWQCHNYKRQYAELWVNPRYDLDRGGWCDSYSEG